MGIRDGTCPQHADRELGAPARRAWRAEGVVDVPEGAKDGGDDGEQAGELEEEGSERERRALLVGGVRRGDGDGHRLCERRERRERRRRGEAGGGQVAGLQLQAAMSETK